MSIDAVIDFVGRNAADELVLGLAQRDSYTPTGQNQMIVIQPHSFQPEPGMIIWGGDGFVLVGPDEYRYNRLGYTRLVEPEEDAAQKRGGGG